MARSRHAAVAAALTLLLSVSTFAQSETRNIAQDVKSEASKLLHKLIPGGGVLAVCKDKDGKVVENVSGQPLNEPRPIYANPSTHQLVTDLDVRIFARDVPVFTGKGDCQMMSFDLRMYGPGPNAPQSAYTFPGPTLVLNKPKTNAQGVVTTPGDSFTINLTNNMPLSDENCTEKGNSQCPDSLCNDPLKKPPQCCTATNLVLPNCFHGNNTTNLHFHGTHVSPQSPQDFVLLELQPAGTPHDDGHEAHSPLGTKAIGSFQYAVNPIPANQSPGTHWYHPHKHGSTALQVGNGMAGAILIRGEFDEEIQSFYGNNLTERVLVVQLVHDLNFTQNKTLNPIPLINGQLQPAISMRPGEIQRWRIINANMAANAQLTIDFNGPDNTGLTAMQIAMDGVRFSPTNYACQPLLNTSFTTPCTAQPVANPKINISPGNRMDILVQAPAKAGMYATTFDVFGNVDRQDDERPQGGPLGRGKRQPTVGNLRQVLDLVAPGASEPALLVVNVSECADPAQCPPMKFPPSLSPMPSYLRNIPANTDGSQVLQFRLDKTAGTPGLQGLQPQLFGIGVQNQATGQTQQFDADCANFTEPLGRTETWTISQNLNDNGKPFHVFHIHINPFQVVRFGSTTYPEPIWMDSITLPNNAAVKPSDGFPTDTASTVQVRQRFEDYTGAYVFHCHFLGHEDRGMMMMVQTTCPNAEGNLYGPVRPDGSPDDCTICLTNPEKCKKGLPPCGSASSQLRERKTKH